MNARPFLTAEWRSLLMVNYAIDLAVLAPLVPRGVELDLWRGEALVSMVGFLFLDTRICGVPVPFHRNFPEVNLRFYVKRRVGNEWRRGVTFVREIVPRWWIATTARLLYNEPYLAVPTRNRIRGKAYEFSWKFADRWHSLAATVRGTPAPMAEGSEEEFIFEHYWGYTAQRDGGTVEYRVAHPRWEVHQVTSAQLDCDIAAFYGPAFVAALSGVPHSAFVGVGSPVAIYPASRVATERSSG